MSHQVYLVKSTINASPRRPLMSHSILHWWVIASWFNESASTIYESPSLPWMSHHLSFKDIAISCINESPSLPLMSHRVYH
jgi:hypothetical protein